MQYLLPLLSVIIGYLIAVILKPSNKKNIKLLLAFSGAFLLSLTVMHLLPEVDDYAMQCGPYGHHDHWVGYMVGAIIMVGILFQILLASLAKGAEHGHVHGQGKLTSMPWGLFMSLCSHAPVDGVRVRHHHD